MPNRTRKGTRLRAVEWTDDEQAVLRATEEYELSGRFISIAELALATGLPKETARRVGRELEAAGVISCLRAARTLPNGPNRGLHGDTPEERAEIERLYQEEFAKVSARADRARAATEHYELTPHRTRGPLKQLEPQGETFRLGEMAEWTEPIAFFSERIR